MEKEKSLRGKTPQTKQKQPHNQHTEETQPSPAYAAAVLALLEGADSALLGQLPGELLTQAVGRLGNQAALATLSAQKREPAGLPEVAAILEGAVVPPFSEDAPANAVDPLNGDSPVALPDFRFFGGQPVSFEAVSDVAMGMQGL